MGVDGPREVARRRGEHEPDVGVAGDLATGEVLQLVGQRVEFALRRRAAGFEAIEFVDEVLDVLQQTVLVVGEHAHGRQDQAEAVGVPALGQQRGIGPAGREVVRRCDPGAAHREVAGFEVLRVGEAGE